MNAHVSAAKLSGSCRNLVQDELQKILRSAMTRFNDDELADAAGIDVRALRCYRNEGREPTLSRALALLLVLGRTDLNRILDIIGYKAVPLDEAGRIPHAGKVVASSMASLSTLATAAADGRFDHTELPACRQAADALIECVLPLSSAGAAA